MYPRTFTLPAGLLMTALAGFSQSDRTLTGTVGDAMCGAKHMMTNETAAQCTRECVKQGSDCSGQRRQGLYAERRYQADGQVCWSDRHCFRQAIGHYADSQRDCPAKILKRATGCSSLLAADLYGA